MNATTTRRPVRSIPTTIAVDQIPDFQKVDDLSEIVALPMEAGERISVKTYGYRGTLSNYGHHFTLGSVAAYAASYGEDVDASIEREKRIGGALYYASAEGVMITAHKQAPVKRFELELGTVIQMDGQNFQILESPNDNLALVPFPTA